MITVGHLRRALDDLPDYLCVDLLVDGCVPMDDADVELLAPLLEVRRGMFGVEVVVDWSTAG